MCFYEIRTIFHCLPSRSLICLTLQLVGFIGTTLGGKSCNCLDSPYTLGNMREREENKDVKEGKIVLKR